MARVSTGETGGSSNDPDFDRGRVSIDFWLNYHAMKSDFAGLEDAVKRGGYDIYIPEVSDRTPESDQEMRKLARGDVKVYKRLLENTGLDSALRESMMVYFASHINLVLVDYTDKQLRADDDHQAISPDISLRSLRTLEEAIAYCTTIANRGAKHYERRDDNIATNLNMELPTLVERHPRLSERDDIRALLSIGLLHTLLPQKVAQQGYPVKVIHRSVAMTPMMELNIKVQQGEEASEELLTEAALGIFLQPCLQHTSSEKQAEVIKKITSAVPRSEVEILIASFQIYGTPVVASFAEHWICELGIADPELIINPRPQRVAGVL